MWKSDYKNVWLALIGLAFFVSCSDKDSEPSEQILYGNTMGTTYSIKMIVSREKLEDVELAAKVTAKLEYINQVMSTYIEDSELSVLNKSRQEGPVTVSPELKTVLSEALRLGRLTEGALDITLGPLVNLWGFGPDKRVTRQPSATEIEQQLTQTGLRFIKLEGNQVTKLNPNVYIDLSSLAKGYGVDQLAELLEEHGITNYLVEVGGEMRLSGHKLNGKNWRIAVEKPVSNRRAIQRLITPRNNGVATSGDYRNYFEEEGVRYSHMIDPTTGKPITHRLVSVTIIHPSSMTADGLSTAISVLGPEKGYELVKQQDIAALLIIKTDKGFEELMTDRFKQHITIIR